MYIKQKKLITECFYRNHLFCFFSPARACLKITFCKICIPLCGNLFQNQKAQHPNPELETLADNAVDIVCAAQQEDGYLDTYYILNGKDKIFSNVRDNHELYCLGHLREGAAAYYQATGKDKLLKAACRFADYTAVPFGSEEEKCKGYPGHEIAEMALVRLYEVTGDEKYLNLSRYFVNQRGTRPYYFDKEHPQDIHSRPEDLRYEYHQAHLPVRKQTEAVGHAVRAVYLYSGMADLARLIGHESLYQACETLWNNVENKKCTSPVVSAQPISAKHFPTIMTCPMTPPTPKPAPPSAWFSRQEECWKSARIPNMPM